MDAIQIIAIILFAGMYVGLLTFPKIRPYITISMALVFLILLIIYNASPDQSLLATIRETLSNSFSNTSTWNVLMLITGTMGVVSLFIDSKMPNLLADLIIEKTSSIKWAIISLALFAGIISAFVDNVATVLMVAPVALNVCKKLKISPVLSIIAISISSNLQGAATLVGDTTSILLAQQTNMNFVDFIWYQGRPGIFWIVEIGAIASTLILLFIFRKNTQDIVNPERTIVTDYFPSYLLAGTILLLIIASFFPILSDITLGMINGIICLSLFIIGLIKKHIQSIKNESLSIKENLKQIDLSTLFLLLGLFIVIGALDTLGIIQKIGELFLGLGGNVFLIYSIIVWFSVFISAFIDNIPYVMTMLPVVGIIVMNLNANGPVVNPNLLYFGLLIGATLGGNITPIGASANITGIGILRAEGYEVKTSTFMKLSIPFTLIAVTTGFILNYLIWGIVI
ncbi:MAG: SLC13 family permease [Bacilli bacterium]|jgi:Na+/H+ antiporter NhaD/arsenite permease-like protein|nr:SLC13 family permease [Bacilli bacterium]MDD2681484.1 SLC13 family permease [Bacilli bacterium]MDD3121875.1 SLC13 family permease [Bacilli bacterium]MDD4062923.1 SLC13 family permease [Bacilli bacterium]MDD4482281.1 SLC13 family permease [Bacilli bacterium]